MTLGNVLAHKVRELRLAAGLTQRELAERAVVGRQTIINVEQCSMSTTLRTVALVAEALDVAPHTLLDPDS